MSSSPEHRQDATSLQLSVIIVNWNGCDLLRRCLQAARDSAQRLDCEIIVVDNASADGSPQMVQQEFPGVRLIQNSNNVGFARANNQAIGLSRGDFILLLNSDAFPSGDAIPQILGGMETDPRIGIAGAYLVNPDGSPQFSHGPLPTLAMELKSLTGLDKRVPARDADQARPLVDTGRVVGACLMARREMLDQIGLLDESFYFFSEEVDLCARAHAAGWRVVQVLAATVVHVGGGSTGTNARRVLMLYREKLRYFGKHHGAAARGLLRAAMWLTTLGKVLAYSIVRIITAGRLRKDRLWLDVARGLRQVDSM